MTYFKVKVNMRNTEMKWVALICGLGFVASIPFIGIGEASLMIITAPCNIGFVCVWSIKTVIITLLSKLLNHLLSSGNNGDV